MDAVVGGKWARGHQGYGRHLALDVDDNRRAACVQGANGRRWDICDM